MFETIINEVPGNTPPSDSGASASGESEIAQTANEPMFAQSEEINNFLGVTVDEDAADSTTDDSAPADISTEDDSAQSAESDDSSQGDEAEKEEGSDELPEEEVEQGAQRKDPKIVNYLRKRSDYLSKENATLKSELEALKTTPSNEASGENVEFLSELRDQLFGFSEQDGEIVPRTGDFARTLFEKSPDKAIELINELVAMPSPANENETIFDTLLKTPEVQEYIKQTLTQETDPHLDDVPDDYREAYTALPDELKDSYRLASDSERLAMLKQSQRVVEIDKANAEKERAEKERAETEHQATITTTIEKNLNVVSGEFAKSLEQIPFSPDPLQNAWIRSAVEDNVIVAVKFPDHQAGKEAISKLKDMGVTIPDDTHKLYKELEQYSRYAAQYKQLGKTREYNAVQTEISTRQKQLLGRQNQISTDIAKAFASKNQQISNEKGSLLTGKKTRPSINGDGSGSSNSSVDYSNLSMAEIVAMG